MAPTASERPRGPFKLVTVNTAPERAKRLIGQVAQDVSDQYTIIHAANCETIEEVQPTLEKIRPELLFCASMWTAEESGRIRAVARETVPGIKTHAILQGLQVERGPDAVVEYLKERLPSIIDGVE